MRTWKKYHWTKWSKPFQRPKVWVKVFKELKVRIEKDAKAIPFEFPDGTTTSFKGYRVYRGAQYKGCFLTFEDANNFCEREFNK